MSASHVHRRNNAPKWSSTFPMQATAPDTNPFRKLPIWVRLIILVTILSTGTVVLSRLLTWTPKAITRAPIKVDSGSSGILLVETPPPTTTKPKVLVDGTVGIKVLNDHLEAAKVAAEAAAKVPSVTSEVWKRVAPIDKPEDKVDAFAAAHRAANSSMEAAIEASSLRKKQQKAKNINNNVPGSPPSNSEEFWLSYPHDDTLSKCGTFSPKRHLVRVCSEEEMLDFRFFRLQSVATGRWMGRSVSWEATNLTRAQRTMQFLYHPIHYKAWSIQAQTRLHLTCGSSNRLSFGSLAITGHEMWMPVFGNASGPTRTVSAPTSTSELPMSTSTRPSRKSKQLRKRPQLLQQQVEVMSFDHKYSSEDATSGPYMYLQSMRSNRFVASKDATMWASGNNRTDTDYIVQFIMYADVRRRCQPLEDVAHQSVSASADIDGDSTQPEKLSRRQKAINEGNTCFGKRYTPKGPFLHPPNDANTLLPLVSTYQLPNESYVANLSNPIDPTVIVRRTLANWALLGGVQPLLLVDTNHSRGVVNEVLGRVDRLIQLGELEDPRLGARELLWAYLNSTTTTTPATTTEPPTSATTVATADITLESIETTVDPHILRSTRKGDKSNSTTTRPSNNKKKVAGGLIPTTSTPPAAAAIIAPALDMKGDGFEMDSEFKKPTYRGLFHAAFQRYPYTPYVMYSNIDVLYTSSLIVSLRAVEKYVANQIWTRAEAGVTTVIRGWMVVGLRHGREMPAGWSPLSKSATSWEGDVMGYTKSYSSPDEPSPDTLDRDAIDYIIVSRGLFDWMNSIPTFVVGGIKFKKWIVNKANKLAQSGEALVFDGSATITAVHQKPHIGGGGDGQHYVESDLPSHVYNSRLATENGGWSMGSVGDVSLALEFDNGPNITVYDKHRLLFG